MCSGTGESLSKVKEERSRLFAFLRNIKYRAKLYSPNIKHLVEQKFASETVTNASKRWKKGLHELEPFQNTS